MNKKGFTLIEMLIVVAIIGIVAAIAIPNLMQALQRGKQRATMADMKTCATSVESYMTDNYFAPANISAATLGALHGKNIPTTDAWGTTFAFVRNSSDTDIYSIGSGGKDLSFSGWTANANFTVTSMSDFNNDIILSNGSFTAMPKTK